MDGLAECVEAVEGTCAVNLEDDATPPTDVGAVLLGLCCLVGRLWAGDGTVDEFVREACDREDRLVVVAPPPA